MNMAGYDAIAIGNHEFDYGKENLDYLISISTTPLIACNIEGYRPSVKINKKGVEFYIYGAITDDLYKVVYRLEGVKLKDIKNIELSDAINILLSHKGLEEDIRLAKLKKFDFIIGGHSHTLLKKPKVIDNSFIVQAGAYGDYAGRIDFYVAGSRIIKKSYSVIKLEKIGVNKEVMNYVNFVKKEANTIIGIDIDKIVYNLKRSLNREEVGLFMCRVMKGITGASISFQNRGGVRSSLEGGINYRKIYEVMPFDNKVILLKLKGKYIYDIFKYGRNAKYGMLYYTGLYENDGKLYLESGEAIKNDEYYTVATNSFVADGGDGYTQFKNGVYIEEFGNLRDRMYENIKLLEDI